MDLCYIFQKIVSNNEGGHYQRMNDSKKEDSFLSIMKTSFLHLKLLRRFFIYDEKNEIQLELFIS